MTRVQSVYSLENWSYIYPQLATLISYILKALQLFSPKTLSFLCTACSNAPIFMIKHCLTSSVDSFDWISAFIVYDQWIMIIFFNSFSSSEKIIISRKCSLLNSWTFLANHLVSMWVSQVWQWFFWHCGWRAMNLKVFLIDKNNHKNSLFFFHFGRLLKLWKQTMKSTSVQNVIVFSAVLVWSLTMEEQVKTDCHR